MMTLYSKRARSPIHGRQLPFRSTECMDLEPTKTITNAYPWTFDKREDTAPSLGKRGRRGHASVFEPSFRAEDCSVGSPDSSVSVNGDCWDVDVL